MAAPKHLPNAPIKEALIDLRVALPPDQELSHLDAVYDQIRDRFPIKKTIHEGRFGVNFDFKEGVPPKTIASHLSLGFRYESADGRRVAQFRLNGFTYSRLAPYTTWEEMRDEARDLWGIFVQAASPFRVTRAATRFINIIPIPLPFDDFEEYLTAPPRIPDNLPQGLNSYMTRIVLPNPLIDATAIITQALEGVEISHAPVVLDIDVLTNRDFDVSCEKYWEVLEDLRVFKNKIFFESITEKTAELCR